MAGVAEEVYQHQRNLRITTVVNGVSTQVLMPVVALANANGTSIDLDSAIYFNQLIGLMSDLLVEIRLQNRLLVEGLGIQALDADTVRNDVRTDLPMLASVVS